MFGGSASKVLLLSQLLSVSSSAFLTTKPPTTKLITGASACILDRKFGGGVAYSKSVTELKSISNDSSEENLNIDDSREQITESVIRIDDGGSDLTNRFKFKVNALMGKFDPVAGTPDTEKQDGNILNAMMRFPAPFQFSVVGRTNGEQDAQENYVNEVKAIILRESGNADGCMECRIVPRGKNFVKVSATVSVDSAVIISSIYDALGNIENTVMKY